MRKRMFLGALVGVLAVVMAGGILASNMGFKLNYALIASGQPVPEGGVSQDGTNEISLPDNPQAGMVNASDLITDIGLPAKGGISKLIRSNNTLAKYTGTVAFPTNFALVAGTGYRVRLTGTATVNYIVVGSHNPTLSHVLIAATQAVPEGGVSQDGTNSYNYPYHSVAATAADLINEIGLPAKGGVSKLLRSNNTLAKYTGTVAFPTNFALVPGNAYRVRVTGTTNVSFVPNHY